MIPLQALAIDVFLVLNIFESIELNWIEWIEIELNWIEFIFFHYKLQYNFSFKWKVVQYAVNQQVHCPRSTSLTVS